MCCTTNISPPSPAPPPPIPQRLRKTDPSTVKRVETNKVRGGIMKIKRVAQLTLRPKFRLLSSFPTSTYVTSMVKVDESQVAVHEYRECHRLQLCPVKLPRRSHEIHQAPIGALHLSVQSIRVSPVAVTGAASGSKTSRTNEYQQKKTGVWYDY